MSEIISINLNGYVRNVEVPVGVVALINDAFSDIKRRPETVTSLVEGEEVSVANPQSKEAFTTECIRIYIEDVVIAYNEKQVLKPAADQADAASQSLLASIIVAPEVV